MRYVELTSFAVAAAKALHALAVVGVDAVNARPAVLTRRTRALVHRCNKHVYLQTGNQNQGALVTRVVAHLFWLHTFFGCTGVTNVLESVLQAGAHETWRL